MSTDPIPREVLIELARIREDGATNMCHYERVVNLTRDSAARRWLLLNHYVEALLAMGKMISRDDEQRTRTAPAVPFPEDDKEHDPP